MWSSTITFLVMHVFVLAFITKAQTLPIKWNIYDWFRMLHFAHSQGFAIFLLKIPAFNPLCAAFVWYAKALCYPLHLTIFFERRGLNCIINEELLRNTLSSWRFGWLFIRYCHISILDKDWMQLLIQIKLFCKYYFFLWLSLSFFQFFFYYT